MKVVQRIYDVIYGASLGRCGGATTRFPPTLDDIRDVDINLYYRHILDGCLKTKPEEFELRDVEENCLDTLNVFEPVPYNVSTAGKLFSIQYTKDNPMCIEFTRDGHAILVSFSAVAFPNLWRGKVKIWAIDDTAGIHEKLAEVTYPIYDIKMMSGIVRGVYHLYNAFFKEYAGSMAEDCALMVAEVIKPGNCTKYQYPDNESEYMLDILTTIEHQARIRASIPFYGYRSTVKLYHSAYSQLPLKDILLHGLE
jgi:hypothetical protein